ncbi:hypothetical protein WR25_05736 [Diploscapter pachys]|uniref:Uncharacterized protein n=1 Tax=Diploscapter pachys TaxID=2018661 RepID=A0A2A2K4Z9_9BILA|nr:hypothetical protein WR25_05736 [Diploscapter pachys]
MQPGLQAEVAVPNDAFEKRINERHDQRRRAQLWRKARPLGDTTGNDGRDGRGEVADEKVHQRGYREIAEDLRQCVYLILVPHRADLEKGEPRVHCQDQDRAHEDEQGVGAVDQ